MTDETTAPLAIQQFWCWIKTLNLSMTEAEYNIARRAFFAGAESAHAPQPPSETAFGPNGEIPEPVEDLRAFGESLSFAEADEAIACIAAILDAWSLNGVTHCHGLRWRLRRLRKFVGFAEDIANGRIAGQDARLEATRLVLERAVGTREEPDAGR